MVEKEAMEIIDFWRDLYKPKKAQEALEMAITALKEVQQYREIGTVEECREAREKQTPNKPKDGLYGHDILHVDRVKIRWTEMKATVRSADRLSGGKIKIWRNEG